MNIKRIVSVVYLPIFVFLVQSAHAVPVSGYMEGWDTNLAGWSANTTKTTVVHSATGGNPGGYLETSGNVSGSFDVGALTQLSDVTGDFGGSIWTASVDLAFFSGAFDDAWLRFRYKDSTENGWNYSLTNIFSSNWETFSVTFDTSWSDVDAMVNGWLPDNLSISSTSNPSQTWMTTMSDVYTTEVRLSGEGILRAGIDNFKLQAAVPSPATIWLISLGLGLMVVKRNKNKLI
ncbi:MAG: hypothetical protein BMS9Abin19_0753 [Gammaproteobacteria bacterium]|nr:MAG: hypothetical protein BMS9Abin19_0753 [Gammaproteobacteria bacterium]